MTLIQFCIPLLLWSIMGLLILVHDLMERAPYVSRKGVR